MSNSIPASSEPTRREKIHAARAEALAKMKPEQDARALRAKAFPDPNVATDSKGRVVAFHRPVTEVGKPDTLIVTGVKDGVHIVASIKTPEGQKAAEAQQKARRKMIGDRIAAAKKVSA